MRKIFKYPIPVTDYSHIPTNDKFTISMPNHAKILCVQLQEGKPYIWALVDDSELRDRHFRIIWTGNPIVEDDEQIDFVDYIGTIQMLDGALVLHLFDFYYDED
jgi:hypothetical protein